MAPECVRNQGTFLESDMWSLGVILFQLYTGLHPFRGKSDYLIFTKSTEAKFTMDPYPESVLPQEAKEVISKLIRVAREERLSITQLL